AADVVFYESEDVVGRVRELTNGRGVDVVFEGVGAATWERSLAMLDFGGRAVIAGTASGDVASQDLSEIYYRQQSIFGARMGTSDEFRTVLAAIDGGLRPLVDRTFDLQEVALAHQAIEGRRHTGKIVLKVT